MSALSVGKIGLDLIVNKNGFDRQMSSIQGLAKKAGAALAAAFRVKKIAAFGKQCLELGSDLAEVQNVVDVTFTSMSGKIDGFAKRAVRTAGLSETMAKQYAGTFGAMAKSFGFAEKDAYTMSTALTQLAGDVASFYNLSQDEAYTKLKSVFTGETEALKDLGVVMTQTALDQYALSNGIGKTVQEMTEYEKVALRYKFVTEQLSGASGDFLRTSDGWANQVRILKLQFDSLKATLGQGLINVFTPAIKAVNALLGRLATLAEAFKSFTELITGNKSSGAGGISALAGAAAETRAGLEGAAGSADNLADNTSGVGKAAKKAAKEMKALMGFDQISKISEPSGDDADTGSPGGAPAVQGGPVIQGSPVDSGSLAEGESKFSKFFENIKSGVQPTIDALKRLWDEGLAKLGGFTWGTLKDFWENFLKPVGAWMLGDSSGLPRFFNITNDLLNEIDWDRLRSSLSDFYEALQKPAQFVWTALMDFYESFLKPIAAWTMGEGIPRFVDALTNGLNAVDYDRINSALKNLWDALAPFALNVGEGLLWFWENVLAPLGTWAANEVVPRFLDTLSIAIEGVNNIIEALKPLFEWFWDSVLQPLAEWTGGMFLSLWDSINGALKTFSDWCAEHPGAVENMAIIIGSFFAAWKITSLAAGIVNMVAKMGGLIGIVGKIGGLIGSVLNPWTLAIAAVIAVGVLLWKNWDTIKEKAGQLRDWVVEKTTALKDGVVGAFTTVKDKVGDAMGAVKGSVKEGWEGAKTKFKNFDTWLSDVFEKDWTKNFGAFGNVINGFSKTISDKWKSIKKIFTGITTFLSGVFSGNWDKAWSAIRTVFEGVWENFSATVKAPINAVIGMINGLLSGVQTMQNGIAGALNNLRIDVPDWLQGITGYSSFGFNLGYWTAPHIPYLAEGGFVKKNTPQLAMIGDNRHQGEVVAPEGKLQEMVDAAVRAAGSGITRQELEAIIDSAVLRIVAALEQLGFYVDSEELARAVKKGERRRDMRYNPVMFN